MPQEIVRSEIDKINNIPQKELAMNKAGLNRDRVMRHISESLDATKEERQLQKDGTYKMVPVPDNARRDWAVEKSMELFGDNKNPAIHIGDNTTVQNTLNINVGELTQEQLIDILLGRG